MAVRCIFHRVTELLTEKGTVTEDELMERCEKLGTKIQGREVPGVDFSYQRVHTTKQHALYAEETKNAEYRKINKLCFLFLRSYLSPANRALDVGRDLVLGLQ